MSDKKSKAIDQELLNPIGLPAHIRVKRHKLSLFIHTDLRVDTVLVIKERLEKLTGVPVMKQRLYYGKQLLHNNATLWDSGIEVEDSELTLVFSTGIGPGDVDLWEDRVESLEGPPQIAQQQNAAAAAAAAAVQQQQANDSSSQQQLAAAAPGS